VLMPLVRRGAVFGATSRCRWWSRSFPDDLAALDWVLCDPELLTPVVERFWLEVAEARRGVLTDGRLTIAMETCIRLMVLNQRHRWGYGALGSEVSDSIHPRRFCRISQTKRVPDESTYPGEAVSATGSCHRPIRTRGRSASARSASRTNSAT
jgi:hypothetical protein